MFTILPPMAESPVFKAWPDLIQVDGAGESGIRSTWIRRGMVKVVRWRPTYAAANCRSQWTELINVQSPFISDR